MTLPSIVAGAVTAALAAAAFAVSAAQASPCPLPEKAARVTVNGTSGRVILKTGYGRADLQRLQKGRFGAASGGPGWLPMGLTRSNLTVEIRTESQVSGIGPGRYCADPVSFTVDLGFSDFLVYIDRRYRPGSCEYRAVGEHENKHVSLYRGYLQRFLPELRRTAERAALGIRPVLVSRPGDGPERLQQALKRAIDPLLQRFEREADDANARIDTEKSYLAVQALCDNW